MAEPPKEVTKGERDEVFPNWSLDGDSLFSETHLTSPELLRAPFIG
jgi:hypothetical protein